MKANYELKRIGIGLKTPILLLLLFLAAVFQLKAQVPDLISDPASGHYCINPPGGGVTISVLGGEAVTYTLWKDNVSTGVSVAGTGSPVTPVTFTGTWTYGTYTLNGPWGAPFLEYLTVYRDEMPTAPTSAAATVTEVCPEEETTISAVGGSGTTFAWYTGSCGETLIGSSTATTSLSVSPTTTTTYYGRWENVTCASECVSITITVLNTNTPTITTTPPTICCGDETTLTAEGTGGTLYWYSGGCVGVGTFIVSNTTSITVSPCTTTTYYVNKVNKCGTSGCASITVTLDTPTTDPESAAAAPAAICVGGTTTLTVTGGSGNALKWYTESCGGTLVGTGNDLLVSPTTTTLYYARWENTYCKSECVTVSVTVYPVPIDLGSATASPTTICSGSTTYLDVTGYTATTGAYIQWYTGSCGGTALAIGRNIPVTPTTTTTYWAQTKNPVCTSPNCVSVTVTVYPYPEAPTVTGDAVICNGSSTMLTAVGGPFTGSTIEWYADGIKVPALSGQMTPTVAPTVTTGYYARFENSACVGPNSSVVTVTVGYIPTTPTIVASAVAPGVILDNTICKGTSINLNVTGGGASVPPALTLNWYRGFSPCAGTYSPTYTGTTFTDMPAGNTNYYAQYSNMCGVSGCATLTICVDSMPSAPTSITPSATVICAGTNVTLTANGLPGNIINPCPGCPPQPIKATIYWYTNECGVGTAIATGTTITVSPTSSTNYYARYENVCGASSCASVNITVNRVTDPATITAPHSICLGNETTLEVGFPLYPAYGTIRWYSSTTPSTCGSGTLLTATSTSITVSPTVTTYYYVRTENTNGGVNCYSTCTGTVVTVLPLPTTPTSASASPATICYGSTTTLTALPATGVGTFKWYYTCPVSETPTPLPSGTTLVVSPTVTTTYYGRWETATCGNSACVSVTVTVDMPNVMTGPITASNNPVCAGSSVTLEAHGTGNTLRWYSGSEPCGGTLLQTGGLLTVTPVITSRYFARYEGGACPNSACESITITLSPVPTTPVITTPSTTICFGGNITLNAQAGPAGTTIKWYKGACGTDYQGTGTSLTVTPTLGTNLFYAQMESAPCAPSACAVVTITASANPALPTNVTENHSICYGNTTTLSASGPTGTTIAWYTGSCGGTLVSSGPGPVYSITVSPTTTTKYYVRTESASCTSSECLSVTVTVNPLPIDPVSIDASATTICLGNTVTMTPHTPSNVGDVAKWYTGSDPCGGTLIATVTGTGSLTVAPTLTTLYYVTWNNDCGESECAQILITVINPPVAPTEITATATTICKDHSTTMTAIGGSGATMKWYLNSCGGTAIGTGTTLTVTPTTKGTYVYYARWESIPCDPSACKTITITVNDVDPIPTITTTPMTVCVTNVNVTLNATQGAGSIGTLKWYKGTCGGTLVGTGSTLNVTSAICTTTSTFFVRSENECGNGPCASIVVTVDQIPTAPTTLSGPGTMCSGTPVQLSATTASPTPGAILKWYDGACEGTAIGTGTPITVSPTNLTSSNITKVYYARYENMCVSACKSVVVTVNPANIAPTSLTAVDPVICNGEPVLLYANGGSGVLLKWYTGSNPCGGTFLSSDNPVTVYPVLTSRYFARYEGGLCPPSDCKDILVVVNDVPQTPTSISAPVTICAGSSTTLSATYTSGTGVTLKWYAGECGYGTSIGTGNTITVSPTVTTTYYARTEAESCSPSACLSVTVTVNAVPEVPVNVTPNSAICYGQSIELNASTTGAGNTVNWYTGSCGGTFIQTGSPLVVSPTVTTKYYVRSEATGCTPSACASVTVTINPLPTPPTGIVATLNPVCNGTYTTLSVVGGSGDYVSWYNGSSACGGIFISTSTLSLSVAPTITTIYWARWENGCGVTGCASITITVSDVPQIPTTISGPVTICNGSSTTLTASYVAGAGIALYWYDHAPTPTSVPFATGGTVVVAPTATKTYYARTESAGCTPSACKTVTVTVSDVPTTPTSISGPVTICTGTSTTLTATYNTGAGISLKWYLGECGGTSIATGATYTVPTSLSAGTYVYYARTESTNCTPSNCLSVTVTVIPAATNLTSISKSPSEPVCEGTPVTLTANGGSFTTGAVLKWYTGGCGGTLIGTSTSTRTLIVNPSVTTTYYARFENVACVGACVSVTVSIKPLPTAPTSLLANPNPVCVGHSTTIQAVGGSGTTLNWYSGSIPCADPLVATGTTITVFPQINPTQYSAHWINECGASACAVVNVYIDPLPVAPTSITPSATEVCVGTSVTMTANGGSGTVVKWYLNGCGTGTAVGTGPVLTVTPAAGTYTYYARWENACEPSTCAEITITVYPIPTAPVINASVNPTCAGGLTTLTAVGGGGTGSTIKWYAGTCGGTAIASGVTTLNVSPTATTTYFARYENSACMSECASKTITVYAVPVAPTSASASPNKVCYGSTTVLTANGGSGETLKWYRGTCGGIFVGEGNNLTVTPTATATYYARWENPACQSTCAMVTVQVVLSPIAPTAANVSAAEICEGTSVQLTAVGGANGTAKWYAGGCGTENGGTFVGNGVGSNAALTIAPTVGTTVYYVRYENPPCDPSACASVSVKTYAIPVAPTSITANPPVVGVGLTTTLTANGGSGETVKWYTGSCGGQYIGSGNPITVTITTTTTFYAQWTNPVCSSGCASVTVSTQTLALSGVVKYNNQYNVALNGVHIALKQGSSTIATDITSTEIVGGIPTPGYYSFTGLIPGTYTLDVTYSGTWGGVNATDALVIEQHDAGQLTLQYLYLTAGDVDAIPPVNSIDALWVKMRTVAMVNYFPAGDWVFGTTTSGSLPAINLTATQTFNFVGLCTGDVNGSYIPSGTKEASFISFMDDGIRYVKPGETFTYDIVADKNAEVGAMTLFMNYDENLVEVENVSSALGEVQSKIDGNNIGVAWSSINPANVDATTPVITLTMKAKGTIEEPKQVFTVNGGSEFANGKAIRLDNLNLKMAKLATATHSFSLNNYPNPFNNSTKIVYTLPEKAHVTLIITNLYGEVLRTVVNGDVSAGAHEVTVNASDLNLSTGVYLYKIEVNGETNNFSQVNKMIFTR